MAQKFSMDCELYSHTPKFGSDDLSLISERVVFFFSILPHKYNTYNNLFLLYLPGEARTTGFAIYYVNPLIQWLMWLIGPAREHCTKTKGEICGHSPTWFTKSGNATLAYGSFQTKLNHWAVWSYFPIFSNLNWIPLIGISCLISHYFLPLLNLAQSQCFFFFFYTTL